MNPPNGDDMSTAPKLARESSRVPEGGDADVDLFVVWTRKIREGDRRAFESLFRALHGKLTGFAVSLCKDQSTAADLVQEAFVKVWEGRESLDENRSVQALLYTTIRNRALNLMRDRENRRGLLAVGPVPVPSRQDADTMQEENEFRARLDAWIEGLPDRQKEALRLTRFEGLDHAQAAEVMGCSPRTVNNHLVRALRTLRDRVTEYEPELMPS